MADISEEYRLGDYKIPNRIDFESKYYAALRASLDSYGISRSEYALGSPDAVGNGNYCLHFDDPFWVVYAAERGARLNPAFFSSAWGAANFLLWNLFRADAKRRDFPRFIFDPFTWT